MIPTAALTSFGTTSPRYNKAQATAKEYQSVSFLLLVNIESEKRTVFALSRITFDHLVACLEAREGHICNRVLLMVSLLSRNDGCKGGKREVNTRETTSKCELH